MNDKKFYHKKGTPYRPSNGCEGDWFECHFCNRCKHQNPDYDVPEGPHCEIQAAAFHNEIGDENYPKEWVYIEDDVPGCTAFSEYDWGNKGGRF